MGGTDSLTVHGAGSFHGDAVKGIANRAQGGSDMLTAEITATGLSPSICTATPVKSEQPGRSTPLRDAPPYVRRR